MIVFLTIAALAIVYRLAKGLFTRKEALVLAVFLVNFLFVFLQSAICDSVWMPEKRYFIQSGVLLLGWTAWGVFAFSRAAAAKFPPAKFAFPVLVAVFALIEVAMLVKPVVPGSRRHAYLAALDWAKERIAADWHGPAADGRERIAFFPGEYRDIARPIVHAHTARLPYLLGGRNDSVSHRFANDAPDYVFDEERKIDLAAFADKSARYELMEKVSFGKRTFALYRRVDGGKGVTR